MPICKGPLHNGASGEGTDLPDSAFDKDNTDPSGRQPWCKECHKEWEKQNREKVRQQKKKWKVKFKDPKKSGMVSTGNQTVEHNGGLRAREFFGRVRVREEGVA